MEITGIDHVTIYAADVSATAAFYEQALGGDVISQEVGPTAVQFDDVKLNIHPAGDEFEPHARSPATGTADFCFITARSPDWVVSSLRANDITIVEGPVERVGARGPMESVYFRDPDGNLVELASYPVDPR